MLSIKSESTETFLKLDSSHRLYLPKYTFRLRGQRTKYMAEEHGDQMSL
jgi:hypothetical protein